MYIRYIYISIYLGWLYLSLYSCIYINWYIRLKEINTKPFCSNYYTFLVQCTIIRYYYYVRYMIIGFNNTYCHNYWLLRNKSILIRHIIICPLISGDKIKSIIVLVIKDTDASKKNVLSRCNLPITINNWIISYIKTKSTISPVNLSLMKRGSLCLYHADSMELFLESSAKYWTFNKFIDCYSGFIQ